MSNLADSVYTLDSLHGSVFIELHDQLASVERHV